MSQIPCPIMPSQALENTSTTDNSILPVPYERKDVEALALTAPSWAFASVNRWFHVVAEKLYSETSLSWRHSFSKYGFTEKHWRGVHKSVDVPLFVSCCQSEPGPSNEFGLYIACAVISAYLFDDMAEPCDDMQKSKEMCSKLQAYRHQFSHSQLLDGVVCMLDVLRGISSLESWSCTPSLLRIQDGAIADICWSLVAEHELYWQLKSVAPSESLGPTCLDMLVQYLHFRIFNGGAFLFLPALVARSQLEAMSPQEADLILELVLLGGVIIGLFNDVWGFIREARGDGSDVFPLLCSVVLDLQGACWLHEEARRKFAKTKNRLDVLTAKNVGIQRFLHHWESYVYGMSAFGMQSPRYNSLPHVHQECKEFTTTLSTTGLSVACSALDDDMLGSPVDQLGGLDEKFIFLHHSLIAGLDKARETSVWLSTLMQSEGFRCSV